MSPQLLLYADVPATPPPRKRFSRAEVKWMIERGFLEERRYELIEGDLFDKTGESAVHGIGVRQVMAALGELGAPTLVRVRMPIEVTGEDRKHSLPEPDISVLESAGSNEEGRIVRGDEVVLVVEVADTTVRFDLSRKAALYARAGVREYWVLDLKGRRLFVNRQPREGVYCSFQFFTEGDAVSLEGRMEAIQLADILPAKPAV